MLEIAIITVAAVILCTGLALHRLREKEKSQSPHERHNMELLARHGIDLRKRK
ncbi:hypothetical protein LMG29542_02478 [Paraburkholderia humisilvae]|uniref:Uncharacterized protein n=1 Tax=Paraburkholderia humisilvae TaxID=627669 RepID=A0A6J5DPH5_9BURK|nr:hypothetical protein LMG29542_02478 [Paraburkholderia humisilvae]